jgi:hypothetical protein
VLLTLSIEFREGIFVPFAGIMWGLIICIPFWVVVILFVKAGVIAIQTIIFVGVILLGLYLFLIMGTLLNTKQHEDDKHLFSPATTVRLLYNMKMELKMTDNGGTRTGFDRRKFEYAAYIPERRSGIDRRKGFDRRSKLAPRRGFKHRNNLNHQWPNPIERRDIFRTQS